MELVRLLQEASARELLLVFSVLFFTIYLLYQRFGVSEGGRKLPPTITSLPIVGSLLFMPSLPGTNSEKSSFSIVDAGR